MRQTEPIFQPEQLKRFVQELLALPNETEWLEFKQDNIDAEQIGQYVSALSNSAALLQQPAGYMVWGVENDTHTVRGTRFQPGQEKRGNQPLEIFLTMNLVPRLDLRFYQDDVEAKPVVVLEIPAASSQPVRWKDREYIRVGSSKVELREVPEKERELWRLFSAVNFENSVARRDLAAEEVLSLLDYPGYFDLLGRPLPGEQVGILQRLESEGLILRNRLGGYDITNTGALLFAKRLSAFPTLGRKAVRVVVYEGMGRLKTIREFMSDRGYAVGFEALIAYIDSQLPANEEIGQALRREVRMYPQIAVRELVANAIIHQDLTMPGASPMIEIFADRIEISNPGAPLIDTLRFVDERRSRNERTAELMRLCNICEERGSGIDKALQAIEIYQLPAPEFIGQTQATQVRLFTPKVGSQMDRVQKIRACYQHACLLYVTNREMTNATLRERLGIAEQNYSIASRIIADTIQQGLVKPADPENTSRRLSRYIPFWA